MFYTYVSQLPLLTDNMVLNSGKRLEFFDGYVRKSAPDKTGFRSYVFYDKFRSVSYRVIKDGLLVESYDGKKYHRSLIANSEGIFKYTPFAQGADELHINSFIVLIHKMEKEHKAKYSLTGRLKSIINDPVTQIFIAIGFLYAIITLFVVVIG